MRLETRNDTGGGTPEEIFPLNRPLIGTEGGAAWNVRNRLQQSAVRKNFPGREVLRYSVLVTLYLEGSIAVDD